MDDLDEILTKEINKERERIRWKMKGIAIDENTIPLDDTFEQILISAERYALGRMSYVVQMTTEYITALLPRLDDDTLFIMLRDIEDAERDRFGNGLGMEMDSREWHKLAQAIEDEQEVRKTNG